MDAKTNRWVVVGGAGGGVLGTSILSWMSVNMFVTTVSVNAWRAGGVGPLAGLLAIALLAGACILFFEDSVSIPLPPVTIVVGAAMLALLALLVVVGGHGGVGAFVTLVSCGAMGFAANMLRVTQGRPPTRAGVRPSPPRRDPSPAPLFCSGCGAKQEDAGAFCSACGSSVS